MLQKLIITLTIFLCILARISASRILVVIPSPTYSHQTFYRKIWIELSKNHQVTLVTTNPIKDPALVNLTEIDMHESYKLVEELYKTIHTKTPMESIKAIVQMVDKALDFQLGQEQIQKLFRNESLFDVVIGEAYVFEIMAIADFYNCPKILVSSFEPPNIIYSYMGTTLHPIHAPDITLPFAADTMNFLERIICLLHMPLYNLYKHYIHFPLRHGILKKHLGENVRSPMEILQDIDLMLVNSNPMISDIRPLGPNIIQIAGGVHFYPEKPLPKDLKEYLDSATEGCIYFSLGTNSKSMYMSQKKIEILMEALSELPYKVLWKFEVEGKIIPPKNIKFISWAPQQDILRHPNIKLFITQGGLQSLEESILSHVPMVMLPVFADQLANSKRMELRGLAKIVEHKPLPDKEEFKKSVLEVINNPIYKENVVKTAELLLDQPMTGVEKAVWWIEYVIRHKGAKHLRNPAVNIPTYQYYCLDIIGTLLVILYIFIKINIWCLRKIKNLIWKKKESTKSTSKQKKKQ